MMSWTRFQGSVVAMFSLLAQISCAEKPADEGADGSLSAGAGSKGSSYVNEVKLKACSPAEIESFLINTAIVEDRSSGQAPLTPSRAKDFVRCIRTRVPFKDLETAESKPNQPWPHGQDKRFGIHSLMISGCQEDAGIEVGSVSERWAWMAAQHSVGDVKCLSGRLGKGAQLVDVGFGNTYFIHVRDPAPGASLRVTVNHGSHVYVFNPAPGAKIDGGPYEGTGFTLFQQPLKW